MLAALTCGAIFAPAAWTGRLISLVQVIVPFQHVLRAETAAVAASGDSVSAEAYQQVVRENQALQHQIASLSVRGHELEREVDLLTATRLWEVDGYRLGAGGTLIPAGVVADDLLPWRSSRLINSGRLQGVRRGAAVTSSCFWIDKGEAAGVQGGMAILLRETLVGVVDRVGTHTSRIKLLSDPAVQMKVRIGRFTDGVFEVAADNVTDRYWLTGSGDGVMLIVDVDRRDTDSGRLAVGDVVLSDPDSTDLPAALTIGEITSINPDRNNPLLVSLGVSSSVAADELDRVYVFNAGGDASHVTP